jgi:hypothetical protein
MNYEKGVKESKKGEGNDDRKDRLKEWERNVGEMMEVDTEVLKGKKKRLSFTKEVIPR